MPATRVIRGNTSYGAGNNGASVDAFVFGATFDGVTDDAPKIQAALDFAHTVGLPVTLNAGTARLASGLTVYWNTPLIGQGRELTILLADANIDKAITVANTPVGGGTSSYGPLLRDFSVQGHHASSSDTSANGNNYGIWIADLTIFGRIENVTAEFFNGSPGVGIQNEDRNQSWVFDNVIARWCQIGVKWQKRGQNSSFRDVHAYYNVVTDFQLGESTTVLSEISFNNLQVEGHPTLDVAGSTGLRLENAVAVTVNGFYSEKHNTASRSIRVAGTAPVGAKFTGIRFASSNGVNGAARWPVEVPDDSGTQVNLSFDIWNMSVSNFDASYAGTASNGFVGLASSDLSLELNRRGAKNIEIYGTNATGANPAIKVLNGAAAFNDVLHAKEVTFTETTGAGVYTGSVSIPGGAWIQDIKVMSTALWTAATSATMKVGDVADDDGWYTAIDLKATDLLVGEEISFDQNGGKAGAYLDNTSGKRSAVYSSSSRVISGIVTTVGASGSAGRTRMLVLYALPSLPGNAATKV